MKAGDARWITVMTQSKAPMHLCLAIGYCLRSGMEADAIMKYLGLQNRLRLDAMLELITKTFPVKKRDQARSTTIPKDFKISDAVYKWAKQKGHHSLEKHLESFINTCEAKAYRYADFDAAFRRAITDNWAKVPDKPRQPITPSPSVIERRPANTSNSMQHIGELLQKLGVGQ